MQVYRGMDIGTAKATAAERAAVTHHMIDVADPSQPYSVAEFQREGRGVLDAAAAAGKKVIIVGGSGLHFRALVDPLEFPPSDAIVRSGLEALDPQAARDRLLAADPGAATLVDLANPRRVVRALEVLELTGQVPTQRANTPAAGAVRRYESLHPVVALGLDPGAGLGERVERRFDAMLAAGLLDEVSGLAPRLGVTAAQGVGYRELLGVVAGEWDLATGRRRAVSATTALARRQRTFHRRDPRIRWLEWDDDPAPLVARAAAALEEAGWTS